MCNGRLVLWAKHEADPLPQKRAGDFDISLLKRTLLCTSHTVSNTDTDMVSSCLECCACANASVDIRAYEYTSVLKCFSQRDVAGGMSVWPAQISSQVSLPCAHLVHRCHEREGKAAGCFSARLSGRTVRFAGFVAWDTCLYGPFDMLVRSCQGRGGLDMDSVP